MINHVFIDEYKNKTISFSFKYPIGRQKLFTTKILFIAIFVFILTAVSYLINQVQSIINGDPTNADFITFFSQMILRSLIITLFSFIPLYLGIWKRAIVPTVICSIVAMQAHFAPMLNLNYDLVIAVLIVLGSLSIFLSIFTVEKNGEI